MNCHSTISVHELLGSSIHTREASAELMRIIENEPCDYVELDFSSIVYISRSFADQFHTDKLNCIANTQKNIVVLNANDHIIRMLQAVATSAKPHRVPSKSIPVYKYTSPAQLESFLLSI